jgi:hypothetical protein
MLVQVCFPEKQGNKIYREDDDQNQQASVTLHITISWQGGVKNLGLRFPHKPRKQLT